MKNIVNAMLIPALFILLWSSGYIFVEQGLQDNDPLVFITLRFFLAWLVVFFIFLFQRPSFSLSWKNIAQMCVTGIFLQVVYLGFFFIALAQHMPAGILAIILGVQPIAIALTLRESLHLMQRIGLGLGLFGLALTVSDSIFSGTITSLGIIAALFALAGITIGTILQKKYCTEIPLCTNIMMQYFISTLVFIFLYFCLGAEPVNWTPSFIISLSWVTFVISVGAFFLFYALLKKGKAASVTSLLYCVPPVTAMMDYFVFHHTLSVPSILGMVLVVFSLVLIHGKDFGNLRRFLWFKTKRIVRTN